jgi:hypothetical protein
MEDDMLGIYDRGYAGFAFFYLNISGFEQEKKFIARCSRQFRVVDQFIASGKKSQIVSINPTQYAIKQLFEMGYKIDANETVKLRLVRIKLKTGEIEVIATNLMDEKLYPSDIFKWLYAKRWGIETEYDALKNIYQIEQFSGYSPEVIQQDFYATIFIANLHQIFIKDSEKDINAIGEKRQYKYQHNRNVGFGLLKEEIVKLFITDRPDIILQRLKLKFIRYLQPVRPGRSYPREAKFRRTKGKYQTLTNYKRAA